MYIFDINAKITISGNLAKPIMMGDAAKPHFSKSAPGLQSDFSFWFH